MIKNLYSLGLLRNGKVYANKTLAIQGLTQVATNDGVAKLARYISDEIDEESGKNLIKTIVGFYAYAPEMEDAGGGESSYTILDIDGSAAEVQALSGAIDSINEVIGDGIPSKTLTEAINEINDTFGSGITTSHTVTDALDEIKSELTEALTISLDTASDPGDFAKVYELKQGGVLIGTIDIPKDIVIKKGKLVFGAWDGETFHENTEETHYGDEPAIKLVLNNDDVIYINAKDLVDTYTAGDGIDLTDNEISIKLDRNGEPFLTVGEDGLKLSGVQTAIDNAIETVRLEGSDGISIASNKVKAVAAGYSAPAVKNPITVDKNGIKFASMLDCGFYDNETVIASTAEDIAAIANPSDADVFIAGNDALDALTTKKTFKNIEVADVKADNDNDIFLYAADSINVENMEISGDKGATNGKIQYSAKEITIKNLSIANGSEAYNVFEGDQTNQNLEKLNAQYITVDNPSLTHNVFNVYKPKDDCVISIKDSSFNLTVDNSNILRVSNTANATGVTVNFENVEWTYENGLSFDDWRLAGLVIYQPYSTDAGISSNLDYMKTWTFNFKNCKYNGVKVTANNFNEHSQVFYLYNVGDNRSIIDPVANGLTLNFE